MNRIEVKDLNAPELDIFIRATEQQLRLKGQFIAESAYVSVCALEAGYKPVSILVEKERLEIEGKPVFDAIEKYCGCESLPVYIADREIITNITGHHLVRGLWVAFERQEPLPANDFLADKSRIAVLTDVVNPANVGAIFRSAAALGMDGILLTHASVDPLTRRTARVSMGTVFKIPWAQASLDDSEGMALINKLKEHGYKTVAMALTENSTGVDNDEIRSNNKVAVLLGTEGDGLPKDIITACDYRVMIPMQRGVDSLNVAAASAVCFWELMKKV